jgi:hypothetical protein
MPNSNPETKAGLRAAITLPQRTANRFSIARPRALNAIWLVDGKTVDATGTLGNISTGGFCAKMANAPPRGRILHARFDLETAPGKPPKTIEADARVCGRTRLVDDGQNTANWMVNFAFESIHPADEKLMARAIDMIKKSGH